jgi:ribonuclease P protein component
VIYLAATRKEEHASPVLAGFSVPKKKFGSSVKRHRIRRLMAEAWRLNKQLLYTAIPPDQQLHLFFTFIDTTLPDYETVRKAVLKGIEKLVEANSKLKIPDSKADA